jgi:hypothetical protein
VETAASWVMIGGGALADVHLGSTRIVVLVREAVQFGLDLFSTILEAFAIPPLV